MSILPFSKTAQRQIQLQSKYFSTKVSSNANSSITEDVAFRALDVLRSTYKTVCKYYSEIYKLKNQAEEIVSLEETSVDRRDDLQQGIALFSEQLTIIDKKIVELEGRMDIILNQHGEIIWEWDIVAAMTRFATKQSSSSAI